MTGAANPEGGRENHGARADCPGNDPRSPGSADVVLLTAGIGAGHHSAAASIAESLSDAWPQLGVRTIDVLEWVPAWIRRTLIALHVRGMTRNQRLQGLIYDLSNRRTAATYGLLERTQKRLVGAILRPLLREIVRLRPRLVIHTHCMGIHAVGESLRRGGMQARQAVVVTDVLAHRFWFAPRVNHWFVAAPESTEKLLAWGVDPNAVTVSGIPVKRVWTRPVDADAARRDWGLPQAGPLIVLTGGARFTVGPILDLAGRFLHECPQAVVVVLCGTNERLEAGVSKLTKATSRAFAIPFTPRVHELVASADVFVTKSGGITITECLACGVPMVLTPPVPGQEAENADWLRRHGAALVADHFDQVTGIVGPLLQDHSARHAVASAARSLFRPGADAIRNYVGESLGLVWQGSSEDERLAVRGPS